MEISAAASDFPLRLMAPAPALPQNGNVNFDNDKTSNNGVNL